jgi:hypothetical protein
MFSNDGWMSYDAGIISVFLFCKALSAIFESYTFVSVTVAYFWLFHSRMMSIKPDTAYPIVYLDQWYLWNIIMAVVQLYLRQYSLIL